MVSANGRGRTLFEILTGRNKKDPRPVEFQHHNPLKARVGGFVTIDDQVFELTPGDSVTIDVGEKHRVEGRNVGITFIEIQKGDIIDEDDIVRIEDDYGRA